MRCNNIPNCCYDYRAPVWDFAPNGDHVPTVKCTYCEEELAEDGIWFHEWDPVEGEINICPDCWLEFIWDNFITGCSLETFLDLIVAGEKKERKKLWDMRNTSSK